MLMVAESSKLVLCVRRETHVLVLCVRRETHVLVLRVARRSANAVRRETHVFDKTLLQRSSLRSPLAVPSSSGTAGCGQCRKKKTALGRSLSTRVHGAYMEHTEALHDLSPTVAERKI
jgi:hypothetical protein